MRKLSKRTKIFLLCAALLILVWRYGKVLTFFIPFSGIFFYPAISAARLNAWPVVYVLSYVGLKNETFHGFKGGCLRPLDSAIHSASFESIKILIARGATPCSKSLLEAAISKPAVLEFLIAERLAAIPQDNQDVAPVITRTLWCHDGKSHETMVESLKILLDNGADPNATWTRTYPQSSPGQLKSPLYEAAINKCPEQVKILLNRGADPSLPVGEDHKPVSYYLRHSPPKEIQELRASEVPALKSVIKLIKAAEKTPAPAF